MPSFKAGSLPRGILLSSLLAFGAPAFAQPAPVDSGSLNVAPVASANAAPLGSYVLHGRDAMGQPYRGSARIELGQAGLTLTRERDGTASVHTGQGVALRRWGFSALDTPGPAGTRTWARVTASVLNLRAGPGGSHAVKAKAVRDSALLVVGESGVWREVIDRDGRKRWTHGGYLSYETRDVDGSAEVVVVQDPRGAWAIQFQGTLPGVTERYETRSNALVFVGMGVGATHEVWDLRSVQGVDVYAITDSEEDGVAEVLGHSRDLSEDNDVEAFLDDLGLSDERRETVKGALTSLGTDAKDEFARLAVVFWEAEQGERFMERVILSGHSVGTSIWGDDNGSLRFTAIEKLCEAFPNAARQVEDLMIAGCYSQSLRQVDKWRARFPNVQTFWAYGSSAPGSWTGATIHNALWEEATRGHEPGLVSRVIAIGTRKGENVATWNSVIGYEGDAPLRDKADVEADLAASQPTVDEFAAGDRVVEDTQTGPLRDHYRLVQEILGNRAVRGAERERYERARDFTIRLIFYDHPVRDRFQQAYAEELAAGYRDLGLQQAPDFATLSRKDALAEIEAYKAALDAAQRPSPAARRAWTLLRDGLRDLKIEVVPNEWV